VFGGKADVFSAEFQGAIGLHCYVFLWRDIDLLSLLGGYSFLVGLTSQLPLQPLPV
jgi:hypothetical protein